MFNFLHCGACYETFFEKEERDRHRNEKHYLLVEEPFHEKQCRLCWRTVNTFFQQIDHMREPSITVDQLSSYKILSCGACPTLFIDKNERERHRKEIMSPSHNGQYDLPLYPIDHYCGFCNQNVNIEGSSSFHRYDHLVEEHPNEWAIMLSNWKQLRAAVGQQDNHREYLIVGLAFSTFSKKMCIDEVLAKIEIYYCLDTSEKAYDEKSQELIAFVHHNLGRFDDGWSCTRQSTHCLIPFFSRDSYLEHLEREHMKQFIEFLNQYRELRKEVSHIPPTFAHIQFLSEKYGANTSHFVDDVHGIENRACRCVNAQIANQGQMKNEEDETWMDMRDHKETSKIWLPPNDNENEQSVIIIEPHRKRQHCDDVDETLRRSKRNRTQSKRLCVDFNKSYTYEE